MEGMPTVSDLMAKGLVPPPSPLAGRWASEFGAIEPPAWLVKGLVPAGALGVMYGPPACFKSFAALDLALCMSAGRSWLGRRTDPGAALYLAGEGGGGIPRRVAAWAKYHQMDPPEGFRLVTAPTPLLDAETVKAVLAEAAFMADAGHPAKLVVLDTLARALAGADENSARDVGQAIAAMERIARETASTVLAVHHSGKDANQGARGSSALLGAADFMLAMRGGVLSADLVVTKQKDAEGGAEIALDMFEIELGRDDDGDPIRSLVCALSNRKPIKASGPRLKQREKIMLDALRTMTGDKPDLSSWREACDAAGFSLSDKPNTRLVQFRRGAERLQELGFITVSGEAVALSDKNDKR